MTSEEVKEFEIWLDAEIEKAKNNIWNVPQDTAEDGYLHALEVVRDKIQSFPSNIYVVSKKIKLI